jgi:hypothetical protein
MRTVCLLVLCGVALISGCRRGAVPVNRPESHVLAVPRNPMEVRAAIVQSLQERQYRIELEQGASVIALYERGNIAFRIQIDYSDTGYVIYYRGSTGLAVRENPETGEATIDRRYARWATQLSRTIQGQLEQLPSNGTVVVTSQAPATTHVIVQPVMQPR